MKKFTLLLLFLMACAANSYGQCINTLLYPEDPVVSDNLGMVQEFTTCAYTQEYSVISNIAVGEDYIFTCVSNDDDMAHKYISVTDLSNNTITHGPSPLTVTAISSANIRLHYTENAACVTDDTCHTITLQVILSCPVPIDVEINGITTTNATFAWTPGGTEAAWQVLVLPEGDAAPTAATSGTPITDNPVYTINTLTAASSYKFYVRADCGTEFSPWGGPYNFNSGCNPVGLFTENFDTTGYGDLPICWSGVLIDANQYARVRTVDYNAISGDNAVELYNDESDPGATIMLVTPNVSTLSAGTHRLKFFASTDYDTMTFEVGTVDTVTADGNFNLIQEVVVTENYAEYAVDFTGYAGTDTFVAIRHPNTEIYTYLYLDNIRWEVAPLCPDVTAIEPAAVTTTSATINWLPGGSETQWDVVFGPESTEDPNLLTPITPAPSGTPEATISGLTDNTAYKVWVRSACGSPNGNGYWIGPMIFTSACLPIDTFTENFDTTDYGDLPDCWTAILSGTSVSNNAFVHVVDYNSVSGDNSVEMYTNGSSADTNLTLVSPNLATLGTATHRVKFFAFSNQEANLEVGTLDGNIASANFETYQTIALTDGYVEYTVEFTSYTGTDTYLGFRHNAGEYKSIYLENVRWEVAPLCPDVSEITFTNITTDSASLNWYANGSETQWDVVYGPESVTDPDTLTPISPQPSSNPEATLTDLTDNTTYNLWVRSACGGTEGNGAWIGPVTFTTACFATGLFNENFDTTAFGDLPDCWSSIISGTSVSDASVQTVDYNAFSGSSTVEISNAESGATDYVMLVSPFLNTIAPASHRLKFYGDSYGGATLEIGTLDGNTSNATFTTYQQINITDAFVEYVVDFTGYIGTDTYLAFRNASAPWNPIFLDDIRWEIAPLCADVQDISAFGSSTTTAVITWNAGGSETNWQVAYGPDSATDPDTLTPSPLLPETNTTLNGLDVATTYKVWVRSACGSPNGNGAWMGPVSFTTACPTTTVTTTATEGFETVADESLPTCWSSELVSGTNDWMVVTVPYGDINVSAAGSKIAYKQYHASTAILYSLPLDFSGITAATPMQVSTYLHRHVNGDPLGDKYVVYVNTIPSLTGAEMILEQFSRTDLEPIVPGSGFYNYTAEIPASFYGQSQVYVMIEGITDGDSPYALGVDEFKIEAADILENPDLETAKFTYYPNPVNDVLNLSYASDISHIAVFNLLGQKVLENNPNQNTAQMDMSGLSSGSYLVKVIADNLTKTIKILKQ